MEFKSITLTPKKFCTAVFPISEDVIPPEIEPIYIDTPFGQIDITKGGLWGDEDDGEGED